MKWYIEKCILHVAYCENEAHFEHNIFRQSAKCIAINNRKVFVAMSHRHHVYIYHNLNYKSIA